MNTQGFTGVVIFSAAAQDTRGTLAAGNLFTMARVLPEVVGPMTTATLSFLSSLSTASTHLFTSVSSS